MEEAIPCTSGQSIDQATNVISETLYSESYEGDNEEEEVIFRLSKNLKKSKMKVRTTLNMVQKAESEAYGFTPNLVAQVTKLSLAKPWTYEDIEKYINDYNAKNPDKSSQVDCERKPKDETNNQRKSTKEAA